MHIFSYISNGFLIFYSFNNFNVYYSLIVHYLLIIGHLVWFFFALANIITTYSVKDDIEDNFGLHYICLINI